MAFEVTKRLETLCEQIVGHMMWILIARIYTSMFLVSSIAIFIVQKSKNPSPNFQSVDNVANQLFIMIKCHFIHGSFSLTEHSCLFIQTARDFFPYSPFVVVCVH